VIENLLQGNKGDSLALNFLPGSGTQKKMNGTPKADPISGNDFYCARHMIWLEQTCSGQLQAGTAYKQLSNSQ